MKCPEADFHMHTVFCDGKNTPEQMAQEAFNKGFKSIGFTAHSAWPVTTGCEMHPDRFPEYKAEIYRLKGLYKGKMNVFFGLETDYIPPVTTPDSPFYSDYAPEYRIGSVHYIYNPEKAEAGIFPVDDITENVDYGIKKAFGGDKRKAVQTYFETERKMISSCEFDIIGHIDLIRKRNKELSLFDENDSWYKEEIRLTAEAAAKSGKLVEINTGGMARGATDSPYPSQYFLELLHSLKVPIVINSDAHQPKHIGYEFKTAVESALKAGYKESFILTEDGWKPTPII
ncbi:MAG: histidinol-phosphatase [Treponemataceae bacterium]|nr:histidinol-phosphatase [Treponemataceae bacterium]